LSAFVEVEYMRRRGIAHLAPHRPHVKATCQRAGIACWYSHSSQDWKTTSAEHEKQW
jgi:hypothetical protein